MNISIICNNENYYHVLKKIGFYGVDFSFAGYSLRDTVLTEEYTDSVMKKYELLQKEELSVCQTHLTGYPSHIKPVGDGTYKAFEDYMLPMFIKQIELTAKMNCRTAVIHLYFEKDREKSRKGNLQLLSKLLPVLEKNKVILSIENIYGPNSGEAHLSSAEDLLYYIDYFKSEYLGICLDTGHAIIRNQNPTEMLKKIQSHLTALHIHTTLPPMDLHLIPQIMTWEEKIDWKDFYAVLAEIDYKGTFNMEVKVPVNMCGGAVDAYYRLAHAVAKEIIGK